MSNYGNSEQVARYLEALEVEKDGYKAKIETCKTTGDDVGIARYENRIKQVDAEIANVNGADSDDDGPLSIEQQIDKATKVADVNDIAAGLNFEFPEGVSKLADKKAALLELVQA